MDMIIPLIAIKYFNIKTLLLIMMFILKMFLFLAIIENLGFCRIIAVFSENKPDIFNNFIIVN